MDSLASALPTLLTRSRQPPNHPVTGLPATHQTHHNAAASSPQVSDDLVTLCYDTYRQFFCRRAAALAALSCATNPVRRRRSCGGRERSQKNMEAKGCATDHRRTCRLQPEFHRERDAAIKSTTERMPGA